MESAKLSHSFKMGGYLRKMAARLMETRRLMKPTASIYPHCDPTASHCLKAAMDALFGQKQFRNGIVWERTTSRSMGKQVRARPRRSLALLAFEFVHAERLQNPA